ncbi:MAG: MOSC domain-containing protein [Rectinemataceae bacterium]
MNSEGDFEIVSLNVSQKTGTRKKPVERARFAEAQGMEGDAHAGIIENRQVSLLAIEEIEEANERLAATNARVVSTPEGASLVRGKAGLSHLAPGDFAENITTRGIVLHELPLGTRLEIGGILLEVSKIGKECHAACEIRTLVGDCVMPRKGIFARVVKGGEVGCADRGHYRLG